MQAQRLEIPDVVVLEPRVFGDDRGFLYESFSERSFREAVGIDVRFVQDNHSRSARGVLRGLHYQLAPSAQGKLVRVVRGAVFDVAVDLRRGSPTFGRWVGAELSESNRRQLWIPEGFAHGFLALQDGTEVLYKATAFYDPVRERCIRWNDATLAIEWPDVGEVAVSAKDAAAPGFVQAEPVA
ncbi:MAG: dTDP-4-dehydrorhamnose 3,5-epimerase [Phycisphaerales bacterium]